MDPATVATISGLAAATKSAIDAALAVLARGKGKEAEKAVKEAQELIEGLKARLFELQEIAFRLSRELGEAQEQNRQLREDIGRKEERTAERKKYRREVKHGATVLVNEDEPNIYYCATCYGQGKLVPLQPVSGIARRAGNHRCGGCGQRLDIF